MPCWSKSPNSSQELSQQRVLPSVFIDLPSKTSNYEQISNETQRICFMDLGVQNVKNLILLCLETVNFSLFLLPWLPCYNVIYHRGPSSVLFFFLLVIPHFFGN